MINLNRRHLLAGAAAAGAASAVTSLGTPAARASVPPAGAQAPGFYRYKVGDYECTSINDGVFLRPIDNFVTNVPKEQAQAAAAATPGPAQARHGPSEARRVPGSSASRRRNRRAR